MMLIETSITQLYAKDYKCKMKYIYLFNHVFVLSVKYMHPIDTKGKWMGRLKMELLEIIRKEILR